MYNKKTLSKATAELDKAKAPKKPKDIITDPMGQWKYPGLPTRIPGNDITMEGVGYPVLGVANNGQRKIMLPGADYTFPGADYVDEYPQMKKGGAKKKRKTKSIMGINKLMQKGPLFQDYSKRIYDPNVNYFQKGGPQNTSGPRNIQPSYDYDDQQFHQNDPAGYDEFINGPGHAPDTYKFPNHPTFSKESMYSNEETPGGKWMENPDGSWKFKASSTNRKNMSKEELENYFNEVEPGNELEYQEGGINKSSKGTVTNVIVNKNGSKTVQVKTKDGKYYEKIIPKQTTFAEDVKSKRINPIPEYQYKKEIEALPGHSMKAGSTHKQSIPGKIADVIFNPFTTAGYAVRGQEIPDFMSTKIKNNTLGYYDNAGRWQSDRNPFDIAADLGPIGWSHSASDIMGRVINKPEELTSEDNLWDVANILTAGLTRIKPRFKLAKNTYVPANQYKFNMGLSNPATVNTQTVAKELLSNASGHGNFKNGGEFEQGGYIEADLTDDEIEEYRKGGFIVEDISIPELNQAQKGETVEISDPKEFAYRNKMYNDSLNSYNTGKKVYTNVGEIFEKLNPGSEYINNNFLSFYQNPNKKPNYGTNSKGISPEGYGKKFKQDLSRIHFATTAEKKAWHNVAKNLSELDALDTKPVRTINQAEIPTLFVYKKPTQKVVLKTKSKPIQDTIIQKPIVQQEVKPIIQQNIKPVQKTGYPQGYQPYSLYGKVLDPEVYGYAESLNGKPVQVAQFGDTYAHKAKMDAYKKSGKYPWKKMGGLVEAQKGGQSKVILSKEHTDKKGNKTIVVTKEDGTKYTKVISKDGKIYNDTQAGLSPEMRAYGKKKAEWEDRSSGAAQPVDDFWTLPIGMSSAGVKGTIGLAKGLTSLGRNAVKSSLVQSGKAGVKQLMNAAPKSLPGANLKNLLNSAFITSGINNYIDQNSDVRRATKKAYDDPTFDNVGEAIGENVWNAFNFSGLNVGKGVKQLGKYATTLPGKLSKTKANSIPKRVTNIGLDTYSGDSFSPIRMGGNKYKHAGQEWYHIDAGDYPGVTWEETKKYGLEDAGRSLNYLFKKNPNYSKKTFDNVGDFDYKQFSEGDNALKDLKSSITSEPMLGKADVYSNAELQKKIQNYKNWRNEIDEIYKEYKKLDPSGNSSNSDLRNLHPHLKKRWDALKNIDKSITDKFITKEQEKLIRENYPELIPTLDTRNNLSRNSLKRLGENGLEEPMSEEVINFLKSQNLYKEPNKNLLRFEPGKMNKLGGLVKAQKGSIVLKLTSKEIQDYIKQGYIVEDVD